MSIWSSTRGDHSKVLHYIMPFQTWYRYNTSAIERDLYAHLSASIMVYGARYGRV